MDIEKQKISWPLFNYFISQEEEYRTDNINFKLSVGIKDYNNNNLLSKFNSPTSEINNDNIINNSINLKFLKYKQNNCRYDTFLYMYILILKSYLEKDKMKLNQNINAID